MATSVHVRPGTARTRRAWWSTHQVRTADGEVAVDPQLRGRAGTDGEHGRCRPGVAGGVVADQEVVHRHHVVVEEEHDLAGGDGGAGVASVGRPAPTIR